MRQEGFTVTEMLAALVILSLAMIPLGEAIRYVTSIWQQTEQSIDRVNHLTELATEFEVSQSLHLDDKTSAKAPALETDSGSDLSLIDPKNDQSADCVFDLVGRRCR